MNVHWYRLGLLVSFVLLLAACQVAPAATPTPAPTDTPVPTSTPDAHATAAAAAATANAKATATSASATQVAAVVATAARATSNAQMSATAAQAKVYAGQTATVKAAWTPTPTSTPTPKPTNTRRPATDTPAGPPSMWNGIPIMPGASGWTVTGEAASYVVSGSVADVHAYYETQMAALGWTLWASGGGGTGGGEILFYSKDGKNTGIAIAPNPAGAGTMVVITKPT